MVQRISRAVAGWSETTSARLVFLAVLCQLPAQAANIVAFQARTSVSAFVDPLNRYDPNGFGTLTFSYDLDNNVLNAGNSFSYPRSSTFPQLMDLEFGGDSYIVDVATPNSAGIIHITTDYTPNINHFDMLGELNGGTTYLELIIDYPKPGTNPGALPATWSPTLFDASAVTVFLKLNLPNNNSYTFGLDQFQAVPASVPEPATSWVTALAVLGGAVFAHRRRFQQPVGPKSWNSA